MRGHVFVALAMVMVATACSVAPKQAPAAAAQPAVVRQLGIEGGCWALETPAGRVQPLDLPAEFRRDGQRVLVVLEDAPGIMTTCQAGAPKRVLSITAE